MTTPADILEELSSQTVVDVETAADALGVGRTLAYESVREHGQLAEGVPAIRVGRLWKIPTRPLLRVLGYTPPTLSAQNPDPVEVKS